MFTYFLTTVFITICLLLLLVILVQRGRGGGLAGAFGMGGGGGTAFGTKTGDVFTTITVILFALFLVMAIVLNYRFKSTKEAPVVAVPAVQSGLMTPGDMGSGMGAATQGALPSTPDTGSFGTAPMGTPTASAPAKAPSATTTTSPAK